MKQILLALVLSFIVGYATAAVEVDTSGLSNSQKAELVK